MTLRLVIVLGCLGLAPAVLAQPYAIEWRTVDGGGQGPLQGDAFVLLGTVGQPDASGVLTGGSFAVIGGYWAASLDPASETSISDVTILEGNTGATDAVFTVSLSAPAALTVTVSAATSDLSAQAGLEYTATGPTLLSFSPSVTSRTFSVPILGDTALESDETFAVTLSNPSNATIAHGFGLGTITNDDGVPPSRVFVSESGSDANACSAQVTPCRNIVGALAQVAVDGEVIILASGEYDTAPLLIAKGVRIGSPPGTVAFVRQPLTISAPGGRVTLRGLTIKGPGTGVGIALTAAGGLNLEETTLDGWTTGLAIPATTAVNVSVAHSYVVASGTGIAATGSAESRISVHDSRFEGNGTGVEVQGGKLLVRESVFVANGTGIRAGGTGAGEISRSLFWSNGIAVATVTGGTARVGRSHLFGNTIGLSSGADATLASFGSNVLRNGTDTTGAIATVPEG